MPPESGPESRLPESPAEPEASSPASGAEPSVPAVAEFDRSASGGDAEHKVVNVQETGGTRSLPAGDVRIPAEPEPGREDTAMQQQAAGPQPPSRPSDERLSE